MLLLQLFNGSIATAVPLCIFLYLNINDALQLCHVNKALRRSILLIWRQYNRKRGELALAIWCYHHLQLHFQSNFQVLETITSSRSSTHDPRVPPRVSTQWSERGHVNNSLIQVYPMELPYVHEGGLMASFAIKQESKLPMLTNVVQHNQRIYTSIQLVLQEGSEVNVIREYCYIKEFGEWKLPSPHEKQRYDAANARCRYDIMSIDGTLVMELALPSHTAADMDYYLVKKAIAFVSLVEILQLKMRLERIPLPVTIENFVSEEIDVDAILIFRNLNGQVIPEYPRLKVIGKLKVERPRSIQNNPPVQRTNLFRSAIEVFEVFSFRGIITVNQMFLPSSPGYLWVQMTETNSKVKLFNFAAFHSGSSNRTLHTVWLPGVLEYFPPPASRKRRCLKGDINISMENENEQRYKLQVQISGQTLDPFRLTAYDAHIRSYTWNMVENSR